LQWTGCESNPQPLGYESDTLPLHHCIHCTVEAKYRHDTLAVTATAQLIVKQYNV